ncbi:MAG: oleate hydratase [Ignavibacteria bacterium]|nr:oleate hydratase [Ignavibacteria bacterium]
MNSGKTVTIIGAGIAGLSSAVFLTEKGFKVTLLESSPKAGGRAYSFFDNEREMFFDNGQHILAGWYENTFEYLRLTGSLKYVNIQKSLEVNFINKKKEIFKLKCTDDKPPMNLIMGLLKFKALNIIDKIYLKKITSLSEGNTEQFRKYKNVKELLKALKQTDNIITYFWEPLILAAFNTSPENVSPELFVNVMKTGFNESGNSNLVIPSADLNKLLIDNAMKYFKDKNVTYKAGAKVVSMDITDRVNFITLESGEKIVSDHYISAVPFFSFKKLFDERVYSENDYEAEKMKASGIISVHIFLKEDMPDEMIPDNSLGMTGLIGTTVQWLFIRNRRHLSLVISGADGAGLNDESPERIFEICKKDLSDTIRNFDKAEISGYKVIKEKRATFIPDRESENYRPPQKTKYENLFIAGDWTDTGLPATIESAVKSSKIISNIILN